MSEQQRQWDGFDSHPAIEAAIKSAIETASADGHPVRDIAHELMCAGLCHLAANLCDAHVVEELEIVQRFVANKLRELRGVN